jgi:predicted nucleotidyltransferase
MVMIGLDYILNRLRELQPYLQREYQVRTMEVYGPDVRGEANGENTLTILVTFEENLSLFRFLSLELFLSDQLELKVNLVMKDSLGPELAAGILEQAKPV